MPQSGADSAGGAGEADNADTVDDAPAATESPTPAPGELPSTEALLEWPYTRADVAWPADDTVAAGDLGYLAAAGLTTAILSPGNVEPSAERTSAAATIDGSTAVVADARLTDPLREASEALTDVDWRSATGRLQAELALAAADGAPGGATTTVLATFARGDGAQASRLAATIDALGVSPWSQPATLSDAIGAPPTARTLIDLPETDARSASVDRMVRAESDVAAFATVLDDPSVLTGPNRRNLLALLDVTWLNDTAGWDVAVANWLAVQRTTVGAVSVVPSSPVNVVSSKTGVPTTILNALPYPVTVVVTVDPSNGRLIVEDQVDTDHRGRIPRLGDRARCRRRRQRRSVARGLTQLDRRRADRQHRRHRRERAGGLGGRRRRDPRPRRGARLRHRHLAKHPPSSKAAGSGCRGRRLDDRERRGGKRRRGGWRNAERRCGDERRRGGGGMPSDAATGDDAAAGGTSSDDAAGGAPIDAATGGAPETEPAPAPAPATRVDEPSPAPGAAGATPEGTEEHRNG